MFKEFKTFFCYFMLCAFFTLTLTACPKKQVIKKEEPEKIEDEVESDELDIHGKDFVSSKHAQIIYFDYDSSDLSNEARNILAQNADYLKKNKEIEVLSEGHCDDRGTIAYNLALGEKRAESVRKYYVSLGIDAKRIGTLSYGKEKPACMESTEECWAKNRRVETKVRIPDNMDDKKKEKETEQ